MLSVFVNKKGRLLFASLSLDLRQGDRVTYNGRIYLVVSKTFDVQGGFYEIRLYDEVADY